MPWLHPHGRRLTPSLARLLLKPFSVFAQVPASDFARQFYHGSLCLLGYDSEPGDNCWPWAPTLFLLNTALLFVMTIPYVHKHLGQAPLVYGSRLQSLVFSPRTLLIFASCNPCSACSYRFYSLSKHGGSNLVWLTSAVTTPLANLTFSLPFLPQHQPVRHPFPPHRPKYSQTPY
jgi:hypothetical protein